jgi:hypothetical protein
MNGKEVRKGKGEKERVKESVGNERIKKRGRVMEG